MVKKGYIIHDQFGEIRQVYMNASLEVLDIITSANEFHITGFLNVFWCEHLEPAVYENEDFIIDDGKDKRLPFAPNKLFANARSVELHKQKFRYFPDEEVICQTYHITAHLQEHFELSEFPMDRQNLHIKFFGRGPGLGWCWLVNAPDWLPKKSVPQHGDPLIISWSPAITEYAYYPGVIDYSGKKSNYGMIVLRIQRKTFYYFLHAIFPLFLIVSASFSFACVDVGEVGDRLAIVTTLMLASIAFDIVLSGNMPKVSYPTRLDFYMVLGYVLMCAQILNVAIVSILDDEDTKLDFERIFCAIAGLIWVVYTVGITIVISFPMFRTSWNKVASREKHMELKMKADLSQCIGTLD